MANFDLEGLTGIHKPLIQAGRIVNINTQAHTYDVITDNGYQMKDLPIMYPYVSNESGQGMNYIPEVGTRCVVCNTLNGEDFIMGFLVPIGSARLDLEALESGVAQEDISEVEQQNADSYVGRSGNRSRDLLPGDFEFKTFSGNRVRILSGGVIELISSDGQCLSQYIPKRGENLIFTKSDILEYVTGSGKFNWTTNNQDQTGSATLEIKSNTILEEPDIKINLGGSSENGGIDISIGENELVRFSLSSDGKVTLNCEELSINSEGNVSVDCKDATVNSDSQVRILARQINLN